MADVKVLNANNNSYNIKDETARTDIANIKAGRNFSTNEIDTGMTWIDGKKIYRKCFEYLPEVLPTQYASVGTFPSNITIIGIHGVFQNAADNNYFPLCYVNGSRNAEGIVPVTQVYSPVFITSLNVMRFINCAGFNAKNIRGYLEYVKN